MDEPFASLDGETAARMVALTDALLTRTGAGLLLVTHAPDEARALNAQAWHLLGQPARLQKDWSQTRPSVSCAWTVTAP